MKKTVFMLIIPLTMLLGCSSDGTDIEFSKDPHMIGEVITINEQSQSIYVEGEIEEGLLYDKAHISFNQDTVTYIFEQDQGEIAVFSFIEEGDTVKVWFEGPVAESYPVQGTAGKVFIYKD